jgi:RimJ/RimL family protein N-acetyltransferase
MVMSEYKNNINQPIGFPVTSWHECPHPRGSNMKGRFCRLEPIDIVAHEHDLFDAFTLDLNHHNWTYLPYGPFEQFDDFQSWLESTCRGDDPCFFSVIDLDTGKAIGVASYLRITPAVGVIEVGHIHFSPLMQGTPISTEAMYLMMALIFDDLGYRRYEWKCDALNQPSCRAAERLGFMFEGIFRQATLYKNRNRDTAWYSILNSEWPVIKSVFENWLNPDNFKDDGQQKASLSGLMQSALSAVRQD